MGIPGTVARAGSRLGRYELLARVATGGMGEIFLARLEGAEGFEKLYVVKRILAHLADDARFRQMLIAEARIASKMSHPNICQVFELGETDGQLYIVMEYLEGVSLLPLLRRFSKQQTPLDLGLIAGVFQQTTDAMNYAHELRDRDGGYLGIIHRDMTPSNIYLTETGVAKVLDFGIAKARGASTQTQEGTVKGKYAYMAPEQLRGGSFDHRVDIFAMGIVLYEMLALRRLFQRKTDYLTFRAVMEQPIPDIRRYRPDVPDGIVDAMLRALDRDPAKRFESARQFGTAILDGLQGHRPWSQGEIGDFLKYNFAGELDKRGHQVAHIIQRTQVAPSSRTTMPLLAHVDEVEGESGDDEDDGFPSVETEVEGAPAWMPRPTPMPAHPNAGSSTDFAASTGSGTPPPFGAEPTGNSSLQPLTRQSSPGMVGQGAVVVVHKRSVLWPLVAVAMVAIAGGALFLVWKQMQEQKPAEIKITQESALPAVVAPPPADPRPSDPPRPVVEEAGSAAAPKGSNASSNNVAKIPGKKPVTTSRPKSYDAAIAEKKRDMVACFNDHREGIPKAEITAAISVKASGKATRVELSPAALDAAALGACLRNVLLAGNYPSAPADSVIRFPLKTRSN